MDSITRRAEVAAAFGRRPVKPALVVLQPLAALVAVVEARANQHVVGPNRKMPVGVLGQDSIIEQMVVLLFCK
jgi:hypothetical protein